MHCAPPWKKISWLYYYWEAFIIFVLTILFRSCTSPDFGVSGVLDRFQQINPKVVFSVDAVSYNMKIHDHFGKLRQVCNGIGDNLLKTIIIPMTGNKQNVELQGKEVWLEDFLNELADPVAPLTFEQVHFSRSTSWFINLKIQLK